MKAFKNADGKSILLKMVKAIQDNKEYLSEVDGLIGDGDHGMNMNKGFRVFKERFQNREFTFTKGLEELGTILLNEIGGSMGPIYGTVLMDMAKEGEGKDEIGVSDFRDMLAAGLQGLYEIVDAKTGDKTLVDTLVPAVNSIEKSVREGEDYEAALKKMKAAAAAGRDSTKNMIARFGRSARLGERSRGVLDAGATSCCILLTALAEGIEDLLEK